MHLDLLNDVRVVECSAFIAAPLAGMMMAQFGADVIKVDMIGGPIDYARMPEVLAALTKELLDIEAKGARERAENWFKKYDVMPADLQESLKSTSDLPVDIDPIFSFRETVK